MKKINQNYITEKLRVLNGELLSKQYKSSWNALNPTFGYCYIVSEAIYHYADLKEFVPYCINFGDSVGTHWFLRNVETGEILDYTRDQFNFTVDYTLAKRRTFLKGGTQTSKGYISKRGYEMAIHLELIKE